MNKITLAKSATAWPKRFTMYTGYGMRVDVDWNEGETVADIATKVVDGLNALPWPMLSPPRFEADGSTVK